jgi:AcrR family transcriptional regulator
MNVDKLPTPSQHEKSADADRARDLAVRDRRDSRWDEHRRARREQLVDATLAAVARHGADVGMEEIAAAAGTSKTVLYRHFADRAELHLAVSARVADGLLPRLSRAVDSTSDPRQMVASVIDTYLVFVEADPELYRFVVHGVQQAQFGQFGPSDNANPIGSLTDVVGNRAAIIIAGLLSGAGRETAAAGPWGHGLVGLIRSAADWWLRAGRPMPRNELAAYLTDLAWSGVSAVMQPLKEQQ